MTVIFPTEIPVVMMLKLHTQKREYEKANGTGMVTVFITEVYLDGKRQYGISKSTEGESKSNAVAWVHKNYKVPDEIVVANHHAGMT